MQRTLHDFMKKNNTWNIRHLVAETSVQSAQPTSVLYSRLTDACLSLETAALQQTRGERIEKQ